MEISKNEFIENKFNTKLLKFFVLIGLFVLLLGLNNTSVYYTSLTPFGVGLVFALLYLKFNGYILSIVYLISDMVCGVSCESVISAFVVSLVCCLIQWLVCFKKFKLKKVYCIAFALLSLLGYIVTNYGNMTQNLALFVSIIFCVIFLYSCLNFLDATIGRNMTGCINLDEKICGCVLLIIFTIGICDINIGIINLGLIMLTIIMLFVIRVFNIGVGVLIGCLVGIGFSIRYMDPIYISLFVVLVVGVVAFKCRLRVLSVISYLLTYLIFVVVFDMGLSLGEICSVIIGGIIYLIIPNTMWKDIANIFRQEKSILMSNPFNLERKEIVARISDLSKIFGEMDKVYRDMVRGNLPKEKAKEMLKEELVSYVCNDCDNCDRCFRKTGSFMENSFDTIVDMGYQKGKLLLIDMPEYLTTNCIKINSLIQYFNNLMVSYKDYESAVSNLDASRLLIANQLEGVERLLKNLANELTSNISFDKKFEELIKERLNYIGVPCLDCVVYSKDVYGKNINVIVSKYNENDNIIEKTISKIMKGVYRIIHKEESGMLGSTSIVLKSMPKFDIAFGSAVATKTGKIISGDNHSVVALNDGKYMVSICDGMGSGKGANSISKLTLNLIENFYKAGFDNDIILSTVNKLLSLNESETFSTIDLCVIDCKKHLYDFIKLGASDGFVLRSNGVIETISSSGLPIGVLENIKPHITKLCLSSMDMIVMVSDGISDILKEKIPAIAKNIGSINPQNLAERLLDFALQTSGGVATDDMTVICLRVFESS